MRSFYVQGEKLKTQKPRLLMRDILMRAGSAAGIDTEALQYYSLELTNNPNMYIKWYNLDAEVPITDGANFIAVWNGPVGVA